MNKHVREHHAKPHPSGALGTAPGFEPSSWIAGSVRKPVSDHEYAAEMRLLQIELVKLQRHVIASRDKVLVVIESWDAAGKDDVVKHIVEHLGPRGTRGVALGRPSDCERGGWYFQRHVAQLSAAPEFVVFNRSGYNRAGVEQCHGLLARRRRSKNSPNRLPASNNR